ncbi:hypothetical protein [Actinomadura sp. WMMA1423]|uniref:hypothetical protein n=1 Tax=Actinomadura sp. WMMA1423 TaxID=2591108 RepID=UPI00143CE9E3|nr:hypothetical protein [Actinomadura sp. WMMA1423]
MSEHTTLVSRHLTSDGVVTWTRCACGRLRMDLVPSGGGQGLAAGPCPHRAVSPRRA